MRDQSIVTFESIVAGIANNLLGDISIKFDPIKYKDKTNISSFINEELKKTYITKQLSHIQDNLNNSLNNIINLFSSDVFENITYNDDDIPSEAILNICKLYLIENHFSIINEYYHDLRNTNDIFFGQNERYFGEDAYMQLYYAKNLKDNNVNQFIDLIVLKIRQSFLFFNLHNYEISNVENIEDNYMSSFDISYSAFGQLRKYFNHGNCYDCTPTELYHWFDMSFKGFKDEVLTNLISIPLHGKIPYLENLKMILEEDYTYLEGNRSEIDALFKKYNTSEDEFLNHNITDVNANEYFNDYMTSNKDFRNGISKSEVDEIHAHIFDYYGANTKNKAIQFIDIQWQRIYPNHTSSINVKDSMIQDITINVKVDGAENGQSVLQDSPPKPIITSETINPLVKRFLFTLTSKNWKEKVSHFDSEINSNSFSNFSQDIIQEFQNYLLNFKWENHLSDVIEVQGKGIKLISLEKDRETSLGYDPFYHEDPYNIFYRTAKEYNFYKLIIAKPILLEDLVLVRTLIDAIDRKLKIKTAFIGNQCMDMINNIYKKTNEFVSSGLQERFILNLLDYFDIDLIDSPDIKDIWRPFKELWNKKYEEIYSNNNSAEVKENDDIQLDVQSHSDIEDNLAISPQNGIKSQTKGFKFKKSLTEIELKTILEDHHDELVRLGLIDRCITHFKSAYIGNKPFTKIKWNKGFPLLQYYVNKFSALVDNSTKWVIPAQIFLKLDGSEISNKQLAKTKGSDGPIKKDNDIDDLIADFYSKLEK